MITHIGKSTIFIHAVIDGAMLNPNMAYYRDSLKSVVGDINALVKSYFRDNDIDQKLILTISISTHRKTEIHNAEPELVHELSMLIDMAINECLLIKQTGVGINHNDMLADIQKKLRYAL